VTHEHECMMNLTVKSYSWHFKEFDRKKLYQKGKSTRSI